jgi:hypothetical protein
VLTGAAAAAVTALATLLPSITPRWSR